MAEWLIGRKAMVLDQYDMDMMHRPRARHCNTDSLRKNTNWITNFDFRYYLLLLKFTEGIKRKCLSFFSQCPKTYALQLTSDETQKSIERLQEINQKHYVFEILCQWNPQQKMAGIFFILGSPVEKPESLIVRQHTYWTLLELFSLKMHWWRKKLGTSSCTT